MRRAMQDSESQNAGKRRSRRGRATKIWRRRWSWYAGLAALLSWMQSASAAHAFCRESLKAKSEDVCVENPGVPFLFWQRACVTYEFNDQLFARLSPLSESAVRGIFADSFAAWAAVDCGGRKPFFVEQFPGTTATARAEFLHDVVNESVITARTALEWQTVADHDPNAIAVTMLWYGSRSAEIFDVDMDLNLGAGKFADCDKQHCGLGMIDLQNTITHEAGHLLGLGHSTVSGSTMEPSASSRLIETQKRTLEADDKAGYCALDLPEWTCTGSQCSCGPPPIFPSTKTVKTCGCRTVGSDPQPLHFPALLLLVLVGTRAHRRRPRNSGRHPGSW